MARKKSNSGCACCSYPSASLHHGGFSVCSICHPEENEVVAEGPVRDGARARDATYRLITWRCNGAICNKKTYLGQRVFVIKYKDGQP